MHINTNLGKITLTKQEIKELRAAAKTVRALVRNEAVANIKPDTPVDAYLEKLATQFEPPPKAKGATAA